MNERILPKLENDPKLFEEIKLRSRIGKGKTKENVFVVMQTPHNILNPLATCPGNVFTIFKSPKTDQPKEWQVVAGKSFCEGCRNWLPFPLSSEQIRGLLTNP